jgi:hypothetical protein
LVTTAIAAPSRDLPHDRVDLGGEDLGLGAVGRGGDDRLQLGGHGDPTTFGHPGRPEASDQRVHRRPDDITRDQVTGRLGGSAPVPGDVGDAGIVGQLPEHRRRELRRRDDAQVEHRL